MLVKIYHKLVFYCYYITKIFKTFTFEASCLTLPDFTQLSLAQVWKPVKQLKKNNMFVFSRPGPATSISL
jgi:hypothetical protein